MLKSQKQAFVELLKPGAIIKFVSLQISSENPHYFLVLTDNNSNPVLLSCFTTQDKKRLKYIKKRRLGMQTIIWVAPDSFNKLHTNSYIDCNSVKEHTYSELEAKYLNKELKYIGMIKDSHLLQVVNGIKSSKMVEEEKKLRIEPLYNSLN